MILPRRRSDIDPCRRRSLAGYQIIDLISRCHALAILRLIQRQRPGGKWQHFSDTDESNSGENNIRNALPDADSIRLNTKNGTRRGRVMRQSLAGSDSCLIEE